MSILQIRKLGEFPDGPVVKNPHFHDREHRSASRWRDQKPKERKPKYTEVKHFQQGHSVAVPSFRRHKFLK